MDAEEEFEQITRDLARIRQNQREALERADEADHNNNGWMAGHALGDYHRNDQEENKLLERGRELAQIIGKDTANRICVQVLYGMSTSWNPDRYRW